MAETRGASRGQADDVLHFLRHLVRMGGRQVDLVQDRHQLEVVFQRHIGIGEGLGLHALGGVHHEDSALAGGEAAADFVSEVTCPGCR